MKRIKVITAFLMALSGWALSLPNAWAITVKVSINGQEKTCTANPCPLLGSNVPPGANFTLNSGQVSWTDGAQDNIDLSNLDITATANNVTGTIIFWADDFTSGPDATDSNPVGFYHTAKGVLTNAAGNQASLNSEVKLTGYLNNIVIIDTYPKKVLCLPLTCGGFWINPPLKETWFNLSGNRSMKGQLWFKLTTSGHKVKLNDAAIPQTIFSGAPAGGKNKGEIKDDMRMRSGVERPHPERSRTDCDVHVPAEGSCDPKWLEEGAQTRPSVTK